MYSQINNSFVCSNVTHSYYTTLDIEAIEIMYSLSYYTVYTS